MTSRKTLLKSILALAALAAVIRSTPALPAAKEGRPPPEPKEQPLEVALHYQGQPGIVCASSLVLSAEISSTYKTVVNYRFTGDGITPGMSSQFGRIKLPGTPISTISITAKLDTSRSYWGNATLTVWDVKNRVTRSLNYFVGCRSRTITSDALTLALLWALDETTVQISHTNGEVVEGPPVYQSTCPAYKGDVCSIDAALERCESKYPNDTVRVEACQKAVRRMFDKKIRKVIPELKSFVRFGPNLQGISPKLFDVPVKEVDVPGSVKAALAASTGGIYGAFYSVEKVRFLVNNLHSTIRTADWSTFSIGGGGLRINLSMESNDPTIKCEGYERFSFIFAPMYQNWDDGACPDVNLKNMQLHVKLVPAATPDGKMTYSDAEVRVSFQLDAGLIVELYDFFTGKIGEVTRTGEAELKKRLMEGSVRDAFANAITPRVLQSLGASALTRIEIQGDAMIVYY